MEKIDLELIEKLANDMKENSLTEISLEIAEQKLVLKRETTKKQMTMAQEVIKKVKPKNTMGTKKEEKNSTENISGKIIVSPMTGTFYRSPSPGADSFVEEGQNIVSGEVVCIIEAMKMMNEVISEYSGKIGNVLVQDGTVVQKGDKLFVVE